MAQDVELEESACGGMEEADEPRPRSSSRRDYLPSILAVLITGSVIVLLELAGSFLGFQVPNPTALLLVAIAYSAFSAGKWAATVSIAVAVIYEWIHFSEPGALLHFTRENLLRACIFTAGSPIVAAVVSLLKQQATTAALDLAVSRERERHALDLAREQARLHSLVQHLPVGVIMFDSSSRALMSNPLATEVLGHAANDFLHPGYERMFRADRSSYTPGEQPVARALAGENVRDEEILYLRGDGRMVVLRASAAAVRDHEGSVIGAALTIEDATQQRLAEFAHEELAAIVRASGDAICTIAVSGGILTWNTGAERMIGYTADETRGKPLEALFSAEDGPGLERTLAELREGGQPDAFEAVLLQKSGERLRASVAFSPVFAKGGAVSAATMIARRLR